jgi:preprotein translocase subunit SecA
MNKQREAVYSLRRSLLEGLDQRELILDEYAAGVLSALLDEYLDEKIRPDQWNLKGFAEKINDHFGLNLAEAGIDPAQLSRHELGDAIFNALKASYEAKEKILTPERMRFHERIVMLSVIDGLWKDHLLAMDHLKEGIGLRGYAQQDPLVAYKKESFALFEAMMVKFQEDTVRFLFRMQIIGEDGKPVQIPRPNQPVPAAPPVASADSEDSMPVFERQALASRAAAGRAATSIDSLEKEFHRKKERELAAAARAGAGEAVQHAQRRTGEKVGPNDPCPCGSGKKYKKCHGA